MRNYLLLLAVLTLASCETVKTQMRNLASVKPKNYIISMHGLSGSPESFQGLLPSLTEHLSQINLNYDYVPKNFKYSSGVKDAEIEGFVSEFENFLIKEVPVLNEGDKISMVAHSQGGLVGYIWYLKTLDGVDLRQKGYLEKVNGFVTLGTPFWGSHTTFLLKKFIPNEDIQDFIFEKIKYGDQEVTDITAAFEKIYDYFSKMASKNYVNIYYDPRMLNIVGVVPAKKGAEVPKNKFLAVINDLKKKLVKVFDYRLNVGVRWESDQAVNVSSGRLAFNYYSDAITRYMELEKKQNLLMSDFDYSRFFKTDPKVIFVEGVHAKASGYPDYAIASIPDECIDAVGCKHPTYIHILKHLANCEALQNTCQQNSYRTIVGQLEKAKEPLSLETSEMIRAEMRTYNIGFDLELPKNFVPPKELLDSKTLMKYMQVDYVYGNDEKKHLKDVKKDGLIRNSGSQNYEIRVGRRNEWGSRIVNYSAEKNQLNIQLTGGIQPTEGQTLDVNKKYPLQMIINIPGLKKRKLVIPLQPTYTTFLDLQLD